MKHVIPNSTVFLSIKDFVEVEFNGITFYGFVLVVATDYVLVWVGRDSQLSTTDNKSRGLQTVPSSFVNVAYRATKCSLV